MKALSRFGVLFFMLVMLALPVAAQQTPPATDCTAEAQAWYDDLVSSDFGANFSIVIDAGGKTSRRYAALEALQNNRDERGRADYPRCVQTARNWYFEALDGYIYIATAVLDKTYIEGGKGIRPILLLGEFRGYLAALGVTLQDVPDYEALFFT